MSSSSSRKSNKLVLSSKGTSADGLTENSREVVEGVRPTVQPRTSKSNTEKAAKFLPPFIANRLGSNAVVEMQNVSLTATKAKEAIQFTYTVSWQVSFYLCFNFLSVQV
jgi:hypothetical protein